MCYRFYHEILTLWYNRLARLRHKNRVYGRTIFGDTFTKISWKFPANLIKRGTTGDGYWLLMAVAAGNSLLLVVTYEWWLLVISMIVSFLTTGIFWQHVQIHFRISCLQTKYFRETLRSTPRLLIIAEYRRCIEKDSYCYTSWLILIMVD